METVDNFNEDMSAYLTFSVLKRALSRVGSKANVSG